MLDTPTSDTLTPEMARELNDRFFSSDPLAYFHSRIDSLVSWASSPAVDYTTGLGADLLQRLGQPAQHTSQTDEGSRELQVASDAFSLRQHVAESVIRLFVALLNIPKEPTDTTCLWVEVAGDRSDGAALVAQVQEFFESGQAATDFQPMVIPPAVVAGLNENDVGQQVLDVLSAWLAHAAYLLTQRQLDVNAAANKAKHGHAIRPRNNERWALSTTPPDENGDVPLSALTGESSIQLIDTPVIESLTVPRPNKQKHEGIELSWVKLDTATLLAEAKLMSTVHGALFHVAASKHFAGRTDAQAPPYPTLHTGPTPDDLLTGTLTGIRWPVTMPSDPAHAARQSALVWREGTTPFRTGDPITGRVVED